MKMLGKMTISHNILIIQTINYFYTFLIYMEIEYFLIFCMLQKIADLDLLRIRDVRGIIRNYFTTI